MKAQFLHSRKVWVIRRTRDDFSQEYWHAPSDFLRDDVEHATEYSRDDAEAERRTLRDNPDANLTEGDKTEIVYVLITVEEIAEEK